MASTTDPSAAPPLTPQVPPTPGDAPGDEDPAARAPSPATSSVAQQIIDGLVQQSNDFGLCNVRYVHEGIPSVVELDHDSEAARYGAYGALPLAKQVSSAASVNKVNLIPHRWAKNGHHKATSESVLTRVEDRVLFKHLTMLPPGRITQVAPR